MVAAASFLIWLPSQAYLDKLLERNKIPSMGLIPPHLGCSTSGGGKAKRIKESERVSFWLRLVRKMGFPSLHNLTVCTHV